MGRAGQGAGVGSGEGWGQWRGQVSAGEAGEGCGVRGHGVRGGGMGWGVQGQGRRQGQGGGGRLAAEWDGRGAATDPVQDCGFGRGMGRSWGPAVGWGDAATDIVDGVGRDLSRSKSGVGGVW